MARVTWRRDAPPGVDAGGVRSPHLVAMTSSSRCPATSRPGISSAHLPPWRFGASKISIPAARQMAWRPAELSWPPSLRRNPVPNQSAGTCTPARPGAR